MAIERPLAIGIVDLMAPASRAASVRMFSELLEDGASRAGVPLKLAVLGGGPPAEGGPPLDWDVLAQQDALVVTGAEPRTARLEDDPVFEAVARILDAGEQLLSTLYSCLSAHAAMRTLYGAARSPLPHKRFGVFAHQLTRPDHPLLAGLGSPVPVPHSRWNSVPVGAFAGGAEVVLGLDESDWHLAAGGGEDGLRHVFFQGHPEYRADTLAREYRRNVHRYCEGVTEQVPDLPTGCYTAETQDRLHALATSAAARREPELLGPLPPRLDLRAAADWRMPAAMVVRNWLAYLLLARKARR